MSLEILNNPLIGNSFDKILGNKSQNSELSNETFNDSSTKFPKKYDNNYALESPFGKESTFYKAKEGSYRRFLEKKGKYLTTKKLFSDIDLEKIDFTEIYDKINMKYQ
ncbi:hypothetical protein VUJ46_16350 [Chryseobacterium sp. MYb264]|uniref:hypothetical protein n=1 Tax=Chryseobacterium sp. MYb264 TaxID=2745153 RepID=UPI002E0D8CF3|nr:hypothetical protein VUJ46_16350 [Chryseobacterium sp. MYb264]